MQCKKYQISDVQITLTQYGTSCLLGKMPVYVRSKKEMLMNKKFLNTREASDYLKRLGLEFSPATLSTWRSRGGGPRFKKIASKIYYERCELDSFLEGQAVR